MGFFREEFSLDEYRRGSVHRPMGFFPMFRKQDVIILYYPLPTEAWSEIYNMGIIHRETIININYFFFLSLFYFTSSNPSKIAGVHSQMS